MLLNRILFSLSWFIVGGLVFYLVLLRQENQALTRDLDALQTLQQRLNEQVEVNASQRTDFEARVQQLEDNLGAAQTQLSNLSAALQEARELMPPVTGQQADGASAN